MDLNDYFSPVSLKKPPFNLLRSKSEFGKNITIHTPNKPISQPEKYDLALLGIEEDRNSINKGAGKAPNLIRSKLYQLLKPNKNLKITDLGNLKIGPQPNDSYFGLRDVVSSLIQKKVIPIVIGGSQDLTLGMIEAFSKLNKSINLVTVDSRLDIHTTKKQLSSLNYLYSVFKKKSSLLFNYTNIGNQEYLTEPEDIELLRNLYFEALRLGAIRSNLKDAEPVFRDADLISIDFAAIRQADAPGNIYPSPNGFYGEEICQLAKYSGQSTRIKAFFIGEINPEYDFQQQTVHLAAQVIWYFLEGLSTRVVEVPDESENFTKFIVSPDTFEHHLVFYKSEKTGRWWLEIPALKGKDMPSHFISCSYEDYVQAGHQEIPDRWWKAFQKVN